MRALLWAVVLIGLVALFSVGVNTEERPTRKCILASLILAHRRSWSIHFFTASSTPVLNPLKSELPAVYPNVFQAFATKLRGLLSTLLSVYALSGERIQPLIGETMPHRGSLISGVLIVRVRCQTILVRIHRR